MEQSEGMARSSRDGRSTVSLSHYLGVCPQWSVQATASWDKRRGLRLIEAQLLNDGLTDGSRRGSPSDR